MNNPAAARRCCSRCEVLPRLIQGTGTLHLWFPTGHTFSKAVAYAQAQSLGYSVMCDRQGFSIQGEQLHLQKVAIDLLNVLTEKELEDSQALFLESDRPPQLPDFGRVISLYRFIRFSQSEWLIEMLANESFTSHFQPIVYANNPTEVYAYEALLRGVDQQGNLIMPGQILGLAADAGLLSQVDLAARRSAIRETSQKNIQSHVFINFSPTSVYDPVSCLRTTVQAIDQAKIPHQNIVFEVTESDKPKDLDHLKKILKYYRDAGFLVALDDLGSGYSSLNLLHQLRPDFLKLDMELIRNVHLDPYKALITEKLLEIAQQLGIKTVAEGIESIEELQWVQQRGATFAQGYLIGKPNAVPLASNPHLALNYAFSGRKIA